MANVNVKILVNAPKNKVYISGSTKNLGEWDLSKAVEAEGIITKQFPEGTEVEFKVLSNKDWKNVEKGPYGEEIANRKFVASKGLVVKVDVATFNE